MSKNNRAPSPKRTLAIINEGVSMPHGLAARFEELPVTDLRSTWMAILVDTLSTFGVAEQGDIAGYARGLVVVARRLGNAELGEPVVLDLPKELHAMNDATMSKSLESQGFVVTDGPPPPPGGRTVKPWQKAVMALQPGQTVIVDPNVVGQKAASMRQWIAAKKKAAQGKQAPVHGTVNHYVDTKGRVVAHRPGSVDVHG